jgi:hypothetical protein
MVVGEHGIQTFEVVVVMVFLPKGRLFIENLNDMSGSL